MAKPKPDDKEQSKRFVKKAKEVANDDALTSFDNALDKIIQPIKKEERPVTEKSSDAS